MHVFHLDESIIRAEDRTVFVVDEDRVIYISSNQRKKLKKKE